MIQFYDIWMLKNYWFEGGLFSLNTVQSEAATNTPILFHCLLEFTCSGSKSQFMKQEPHMWSSFVSECFPHFFHVYLLDLLFAF